METQNATTKTLALAALLTIALAQVAMAKPKEPINSYFPLHEGDRWVYVKSVQGFEHPTQNLYPMEEVKVIDSRRVEGEEIFTVSNYAFQLGSVSAESDAGLDGPVTELYGSQVGTWYRFQEGQQINPPFANDCIHGSKGVVANCRDMSVPAGSFRDCLEIIYTPTPCSDKGLLSETFAPSIGLIERKIRDGSGGADTWSLKWAQVNGYVFTAPSGRPTNQHDAITSPAAFEESSWGRIKGIYAD
jgi:hypothetical protein